MRLEIPWLDQLKRKIILEKAHHNAQIIPTELVPYDLLTDSLQHQVFLQKGRCPFKQPFRKPAILEFQALVSELFGFPYSIPLAQGRTAEALLAKLLVKNGCVVPTTMAFPTTRLHQELNGGLSVECITKEAYQLDSRFAFKGNMDLGKLERTIQHYTPRWIPYVCMETNVNGIGGQPFSLENLKAVSGLCKKYGVRIFLDACRILENAYQIREAEEAYQNLPVWSIVREICSSVDGLTMSLTKDFPVTIGGLVAFRDEKLHQEAFDFIVALGDGLSVQSKEDICRALKSTKKNTGYIQKRMHSCKLLHDGLKALGIPVIEPAGGHAVLVDLNGLFPELEDKDLAAEAWNHELYRRFGVRGSPHHLSSEQTKTGLRLFRFAVPIEKFGPNDIRKILKKMGRWAETKTITTLEKTFVPAGMSGEFRAWYEERISKEKRVS